MVRICAVLLGAMEQSRETEGRLAGRWRLVCAGVFVVIAAGAVVFHVAGRHKFAIWPYPCGFKQRTALPCAGCGFTTAATYFAQGRIGKAFYAQPAAGFFCCAFVLIGVLSLVMAVTGRYFLFVRRFFADVKLRYVILIVIVIFACGWAVTLARALVQNQT